jgi:hypothetical protein
MNSFINDSFKQNNMEDINKRVNQIKQKLIKKGYFQSNINKNVSQRNNNNNEQNKISYIYDEKSKNNHYSKSMNEIDHYNKKNCINDKKVNNNKCNINLNKKKMNQGQNRPKGKEYIFNLSMSNLNKYKDNLITKKKNINNNNTKLLKQINNKKNVNNMVNSSIVNLSKYNFNSYNDFSKINNFYNIDNDINNKNEKHFPQPDPTPIKINKSSRYINHMINSSIYLNDNIKRNSSFNCLNNSNYNKYFNLNDNNNKNYIIPNNINNFNSEILKDDYYLGNSLNSFYNKAFNTERERDKIIKNKNFSEERINSKKDYNNINNDDYKLIFILNNLNLHFLINVFKINYVSFNDLFLLTKDDLREMKIPIGPRNKIIHFIEQYKKQMKSLELDEISNFLIIYKNILSPKPYPAPQMTENNPNSTMPTTINELSNRVKDNSKNNIFLYNDTFSKENKGENSQNINYHQNNETFNINKKQNINEYIKNNNSNYSFLNSFNRKRESFDKNNIHVHKRNSSVLRNLKASSFVNPRYNASISINKKTLNSSENKENCQNNFNKNRKANNNQKNKKIKKNDEIKSSINKIKQKKNNHKCYYRNDLNNNYNIINKQSFNIPNSERLYNNKINDNDIFRNSMIIKNNNNKRQELFKQNVIKKDKINLRKSNSNLSLNIKMKNNDTNYLNNINNKIIESFRSLNKEVQMFQTQYKKMKKESFDREKKIKNLLLGDNKGLGKIKSSKQQIKNSDFYEIKNEYDNENDMDLNLNSLSEITKNKNLVLRNVCQNKNNNIFNNNISNNKSNTLIYELDIENDS